MYDLEALSLVLVPKLSHLFRYAVRGIRLLPQLTAPSVALCLEATDAVMVDRDENAYTVTLGWLKLDCLVVA